MISLSNIYVFMAQYFYMLNSNGVNEIQKYVRVDFQSREFDERSLSVVNIREEDNYKDESLEVERI